MARELTTLAVEKFKPGPKRREIPDGRVGGLYFVVQPTGKRSWALRYRGADRKARKFTIGPYPSVSLSAARARAQYRRRVRVHGFTDHETLYCYNRVILPAIVRSLTFRRPLMD